MKHLHFEEIDSTNSYLKEEYQHYDNLTFVSSFFQTNGHGRNDRKWISNQSESILLSYLIKNKEYLNHFSYLSMFTAVLVVKYLENKGLKNVNIKYNSKVESIIKEGNVFKIRVNNEDYEYEYPKSGKVRTTFDYINDAIVCLDRDNMEGLKRVVMEMKEKQEIS